MSKYFLQTILLYITLLNVLKIFHFHLCLQYILSVQCTYFIEYIKLILNTYTFYRFNQRFNENSTLFKLFAFIKVYFGSYENNIYADVANLKMFKISLVLSFSYALINYYKIGCYYINQNQIIFFLSWEFFLVLEWYRFPSFPEGTLFAQLPNRVSQLCQLFTSISFQLLVTIYNICVIHRWTIQHSKNRLVQKLSL